MDFMDTLDSLKDKAVDLAQAGVAQSRRLAEIAKLKMANVSEEDTIKKAYLEIGKLYYAENGTAVGGAYAAACERITAARAAIETNKERIAELKQPGDPVEEDDGDDLELIIPGEPAVKEVAGKHPATEEVEEPTVEAPVGEAVAEEPAAESETQN